MRSRSLELADRRCGSDRWRGSDGALGVRREALDPGVHQRLLGAEALLRVQHQQVPASRRCARVFYQTFRFCVFFVCFCIIFVYSMAFWYYIVYVRAFWYYIVYLMAF